MAEGFRVTSGSTRRLLTFAEGEATFPARGEAEHLVSPENRFKAYSRPPVVLSSDAGDGATSGVINPGSSQETGDEVDWTQYRGRYSHVSDFSGPNDSPDRVNGSVQMWRAGGLCARRELEAEGLPGVSFRLIRREGDGFYTGGVLVQTEAPLDEAQAAQVEAKLLELGLIDEGTPLQFGRDYEYFEPIVEPYGKWFVADEYDPRDVETPASAEDLATAEAPTYPTTADVYRNQDLSPAWDEGFVEVRVAAKQAGFPEIYGGPFLMGEDGGIVHTSGMAFYTDVPLSADQASQLREWTLERGLISPETEITYYIRYPNEREYTP